MAKYYNRLPTTDHLQWLNEHKPTGKTTYHRSERCVAVKGRPPKTRQTEEEISDVAGNGNFGFPTRKEAEVAITIGTRGSYIKKRKSVARPRKDVCRLKDIPFPPFPEAKKKQRKKNRNRKAARGQKRKKDSQ